MGITTSDEEAVTTQQTDGVSLKREQQYLDFLVQVGEILDRSLDYKETLGNVCDAAVRTIADVSFVLLAGAEELYVAAAAHRDAAKTQELFEVEALLPRSEAHAEHAVWDVMRSKEPLLFSEFDDARIQQLATSPQHAAFMRRMQYASMIMLPLVSRTQGVLGIMTLVRTGSHSQPYDENDLRFGGDVARRCSSAIAKSLLYSQTLHIATRFQQAALPSSLPQVPGMTFDAFYEPSSEELLVGGDWYDAFALPDGRIAITIGDVLGHGIDAAVWMGRLRNALRATLCTDPDASRAISVADHLMRLDSRDEFSTALVAIVDPVHQTMSCASAGHPGPLIWDVDGSVNDPFYERGLPLGVRSMDRAGKTAQVVTLKPGAFAAFFTDGLLEWNRDILSAWSGLCEALKRRDIREAPRPAKALRDAVIDAQNHQDDIAILTVRMDELIRPEA